MSLQTTALENTSIKVGPARKVSCKAKMARRSKKSRKKDGQDRYIYGGTSLSSMIIRINVFSIFIVGSKIL